MRKEEQKDTELEQELDNLFRKVAILEDPDNYRSPEELEIEAKALSGPDIHDPLDAQPAHERRLRPSLSRLWRIFDTPRTRIWSIIRSHRPRRAAWYALTDKFNFRISRRVAGLVFIPLFLGMVVFFAWSWISGDTAVDRGGSARRQGINQPKGEATPDHEKGLLRPPVLRGMIAPKSDEAAQQPVTTLPAEETIIKHDRPPTDLSGENPRGNYAVQIRAYPENRKQDARTLLEDMRKREADVSMETVHIAGRGTWHRILLGNFSTAEEAAHYRKKHGLARKHPDSFIQRRSGNTP